jgi:glycosyltransferase involved in cell wall biosynthesis
MVPYKKIPLIIKAFAGMPDKRLVVIGDGPEMAKCKEMSASNIEILGYQSFSVLRDYMQRAKAFVFAAEEDFGITLVEAQACGTPVITFGKGGGLETVVPRGQAHPTGIFFYEQTVAALQASVAEFEQYQDEFLPESCRKNAERFSVERFRTELSDCVGLAWQQHIQYLHQID